MQKIRRGAPYSQADWDAVSDSPEWTEEDFARARPAREVLPPEFFVELEKARAERRGRGPQKAPTKKLVSLRLSRDVIDYFKAGGPGWQTRIDEALARVVARARRK